ncbi:MAG: LamG-like jellyroll fold domain-containing protein [bacterium]
MRCEGSNDYVIVPFKNPLNFRNNAFTIELWFQMFELLKSPKSYYILLQRGNPADQPSSLQYVLALAGGNAPEKGLIARVQDAQGGVHTLQTGSMDILKTGQWYHAAFSWDQDSLRLYLNGVLKDKKMLRGTLINQVTENMGIGASAYKNAPFNGLIDEVRVSKVARQPWEFHVNRSRLVIAETKIDFSNVVLGYRRRVPIKVTNGGTQALTIQSAQTTSPYVTVTPTISNLQLPSGQSTTVWLTFTPVFVSSLAGDYHLVFQSSDPTFPAYSIPLFGKGVQSLPIGAYRSDPFTLGLWHFNELTGTAVVDSSGQGMNGSWNGKRTWGKFGGALGFDGQNDICVIKPASGKIVAPKWGGFTVEAWFNIKQVPQQMGSLVRRSGSISQFDLYVDANGYVVGQFYNTAGNLTEVRSASMGPIPTLQWTHAAMSFGEDSVRLFINGDRVDIQPFAGRLAGHEASTSVDTLSIRIGGNWNGTDLFNGDIDEVHLSGIGRQFWEFNVDKARLAVSSDSMDFGRVLIRQKRTAKLAIKNEGVDTLRISGIASTNAVFTVDNANFNVVPGSRKTIRVSYRPNFAVSDTGSVRFNTNDPFMASKNIILKGMGVSQNLVVPYTSDPFTAGLYHFNAGSGTTLADSSGHALHGTLKGGVAWSPSGRFGGSLRFDGANGKVEVPYNSVLNLYDTDFTVEFWFSMLSKPTTTAVLLKRGTDGTRQVEISLDGTDGVVGKVWDYIGGEHSVRTVSMTALNLNQWYHVAFSCDGDSLRLRLNNRIIDKKSLGGTLRAEGTRPLVLGVDSLQNYPFHGYMDELRISRIARETWEFKVLPKRIAVYPTELHFATVKVGQSRLLNFWVANEGDQDLAVSSITGAGGVFTIPDTPTAFTLTRLQNTMIPVKYSPDASNITHTAILTITSNDTSRTTVIVTLEGSGTDWTGPPPAPAADYHTLALYRFNEASGDTARDASQRTHNGRLMNGVGRTKGYFAKGLYFDGVNDRVEIPYHADFD